MDNHVDSEESEGLSDFEKRVLADIKDGKKPIERWKNYNGAHDESGEEVRDALRKLWSEGYIEGYTDPDNPETTVTNIQILQKGVDALRN